MADQDKKTHREEAVEAVLTLRHHGEQWKIPAQRREAEEQRIYVELVAAEPHLRRGWEEDRDFVLGRLLAGFDREYARAESLTTRTIAAHKAKGVQAAIDALAALDTKGGADAR